MTIFSSITPHAAHANEACDTNLRKRKRRTKPAPKLGTGASRIFFSYSSFCILPDLPVLLHKKVFCQEAFRGWSQGQGRTGGKGQ